MYFFYQASAGKRRLFLLKVYRQKYSSHSGWELVVWQWDWNTAVAQPLETAWLLLSIPHPGEFTSGHL